MAGHEERVQRLERQVEELDKKLDKLREDFEREYNRQRAGKPGYD